MSDEHMKRCHVCGLRVDGRILNLRAAEDCMRAVESDLTRMRRLVEGEEATLRKARAELARARKEAQLATPPESEGR